MSRRPMPKRQTRDLAPVMKKHAVIKGDKPNGSLYQSRIGPIPEDRNLSGFREDFIY